MKAFKNSLVFMIICTFFITIPVETEARRLAFIEWITANKNSADPASGGAVVYNGTEPVRSFTGIAKAHGIHRTVFRVFVADQLNHIVHVCSFLAKDCRPLTTPDLDPASPSYGNLPWYITMHPHNPLELYVSYQESRNVHVYNSFSGRYIRTVVQAPNVTKPRGIDFAEDGCLYIADFGDGKLKRVCDGATSLIFDTGLGTSGSCGLAVFDGHAYMGSPKARGLYIIDLDDPSNYLFVDMTAAVDPSEEHPISTSQVCGVEQLSHDSSTVLAVTPKRKRVWFVSPTYLGGALNSAEVEVYLAQEGIIDISVLHYRR